MDITKILSEEVAVRLVAPIQTKIDSTKSEIVDMANKAILEVLPEDLKKCFEKYKSRFINAHCATLRNGKQEIRLDNLAYFPASTNWYPSVEVGSQITEKIYKLQLKKEKLEKEMEKTYNSIVSTLLSLRTFKKVKENFPEAYEYLKEYEETNSTVVALPIDDILSTINKYKEK